MPARLMPDTATKLMGAVFLAALAFAFIAHSGVLKTYFWDEDDFAYLGKATNSDSPSYIFDADTRIQGFPRPLVHLYFFLLSRICGTVHTCYFLANLLLYALSASLLARLILRLFGSWRIALMAALLYITGPCLVESMYWLAAGATGFLCSLFFLLSLNLYADFSLNRRVGYLAAALVAAILAMAAKESAASLPLLVAMIELHRRGKLRGALRYLIPFAVLVAAFFALEVSIQLGYPQAGNFSRYSLGWHVGRNWMQLVLFPLAGPLPPYVGAIPWLKVVLLSLLWFSPLALGPDRARRLTLFGLGWSVLTAIPFLGWETAITDAFVRYFNIPFMGSTLILTGFLVALRHRFGRYAGAASAVAVPALFIGFGMHWAYERLDDTLQIAQTELNILEAAREAWNQQNYLYIGFFGLYEERVENYNRVYFDNRLVQVDALPQSPRPGALMLNGPTESPKLLRYNDGGWEVVRRYGSFEAD